MEWDTSSHEQFFQYYEKESLSEETLARFRSVRDVLLATMGDATNRGPFDVVDVGCGAGAQAQFWAPFGHRFVGVDINEPLIELARRRAIEGSYAARFEVGTATSLPCPDASADILLIPELLEHVADWQSCVKEAGRVLRSGGLLYISTTNKLCPKQQEFNLPLYSWYPASLKRHFERRAITDWPKIANYAKYPAVNWFSFYTLRAFLRPRGFECLDRFDVIDVQERGAFVRGAIALVKYLPPLRMAGHLLTPYTLVIARKNRQ